MQAACIHRGLVPALIAGNDIGAINRAAARDQQRRHHGARQLMRKGCAGGESAKTKRKPVSVISSLTNGREDGGREIEGTLEFPLDARLVRHGLDDHGGQDSEVLVGHVVLLLEHLLHFAERLLLDDLMLGLERVEYRGAHEQVGEGAHDERQGADVLSLHHRRAHSPVLAGPTHESLLPQWPETRGTTRTRERTHGERARDAGCPLLARYQVI